MGRKRGEKRKARERVVEETRREVNSGGQWDTKEKRGI
jgi:hypothetical protein